MEPPGSGHEHAPAAEVRLDGPRLQTHGVAPQEVLDLDLAELHDLDGAAGEVRQRRHGPARHARALARLHHLPHDGARGRGHRDQHLVHGVLLHDGFEIRQRPEDGAAQVRLPRLPRLVVEVAHGLQAGLGVAQHLAHERDARLARARDEHAAAFAPLAAARALVAEAAREPKPAERDDREEPLDDRHATRDGERVEDQHDADEQHRRHDADDHEEPEQVGHADPLPGPHRQTRRVHGAGLEDEADRGVRQERVSEGERVALQAQQERQRRQCGPDQDVRKKLNRDSVTHETRGTYRWPPGRIRIIWNAQTYPYSGAPREVSVHIFTLRVRMGLARRNRVPQTRASLYGRRHRAHESVFWPLLSPRVLPDAGKALRAAPEAGGTAPDGRGLWRGDPGGADPSGRAEW